MENKKNTKADLSKRSVIFFQVGLIAILLLVWQAIEWKTYEREELGASHLYMDAFEDVDVPITVQQEATPPPKKIEVPEEIEIADDDRDIVEDVVESTETTQDDVIKIEEIEEVRAEEPVEDFGFEVVEEVPVFPGCEGLATNEERKSCMSKKVSEFVNRKFNTSIGTELGLSGIHRIYVQFKIEADGSVTVIGARGPHPKLEQEAVRVAKALPEMQPGKQRGKAVGVIYSLPIVFMVQ